MVARGQAALAAATPGNGETDFIYSRIHPGRGDRKVSQLDALLDDRVQFDDSSGIVNGLYHLHLKTGKMQYPPAERPVTPQRPITADAEHHGLRSMKSALQATVWVIFDKQ